MLDDFNSEMEDEIAKSLKKLAEEETNVAKAYVNKNTTDNRNKKDSGSLAKTQVVPIISKEMLKDESDEEDDLLSDYGDDFFNTEPKNTGSERKPERASAKRPDRTSDKRPVRTSDKRPERKADAKKKDIERLKVRLIIAAICVGVIIVIGAIIAVAVVNGNKKKQTYQYNYDKGMECFNSKNYGDAINYLEKAVKFDKGKKNIELKYTLYQCYDAMNMDDKSIDILKDILSYDNNYVDAVSALVAIYVGNNDNARINDLVQTYRDTECESAIKKYIVNEPTATPESGNYDDTLEVMFIPNNGELIYYTTDGSEPTDKSTLFSGESIKLETGTTNFKVVAVSSMGVYSKVVSFTYILEYKAPGAPEVSPASGNYSQGQKVSINVPEGCKAYYTLDGKTPTESSTEYTEEFEMPTGNTVVSVIIINSHQQSSPVAKRNYVVAAAKSYTYEESLNLLKNKLVSNGVIKTDGKTAPDGSTVTFVYLTKTTVSDTEMWVVRYDILRNGKTSTGGYYGIGVATGKIYVVSNNDGKYTAVEY